MARYAFTRNTFLGGELSRRADGRSDLAQYQQGCKQIRNFIVMPDGGVTKRPGSRYAVTVKGASGKTITGARCFDFIYSDSDAYVVMIWTASDNTVNYHIVNYNTLADATVTVDADVSQSTNATVYVPNGENIVFNLDNLQMVQSADVMTFCGAGIRPFCVFRTVKKDGGTEATFHVADYLLGSGFGANDTNRWERMPFRDENTSSMTMTSSHTTGTGRTLTASASYFKPGHVGAFFRLTHAGPVTGYAKITAYTSSTVVTIDIFTAFGATTATTTWADSAWSPRWGYPRALTYYNQRLAFGGSENQPDTFWMSQVSDYFQFEPVAAGVDDAQQYTLSSDNGRVNLIQWMVGGKKLTIGTTSDEVVGVVQEDGTNLNVQFNAETAHGSAYVQTKRISYAIPFVQASRKRVRELVFNFDADSYVANDLSLLKSDVVDGHYSLNYTENGIKQLAFMNAPYPIVWAIDKHGYLYGITRDRQQQISAWHSHLIGGTVSESTLSGSNGPDHPALVQGICVTPSPTLDGDRLWMVVMREINSTVVYYLEFLDRIRDLKLLEFYSSDGEGFFYFTDCSKGAHSNSPASSFSGFSHLNGEDVYVMADGKFIGTYAVSGGSINIAPLTASNIVAGIPYKARLKTARTEGGAQDGSSVGSPRRVDQIRINVHQTRFFKFGFENDALYREEIQGTTDGDQTDSYDARLEDHSYVDDGEIPNNSYYTESGIIVKSAPAGTDLKAVAVVLSDLPYPCTVLGITMRAVEEDV